ncbi:hypothetical protein CRH03_25265 [Clostridium sp. HMb25]|nr:hypothetical protein CRH03_25265 [Clostridium sp. HMb25]
MECNGVGAAKVFPLADGPGTVKVVIADEDRSGASAALINKVKEHIEGLRPIGPPWRWNQQQRKQSTWRPTYALKMDCTWELSRIPLAERWMNSYSRTHLR